MHESKDDLFDEKLFIYFKPSNCNMFLYYMKNFFIFNTYTQALVHVNEALHEFLRCWADNNTPKRSLLLTNSNEFSSLYEGGFIVRKDLEESERIFSDIKNQLGQSKCLYLTIIPTSECNLTCKYCYEIEQHDFMPLAVQKNLIKFIKNNLNNKERLFVTWFGGEPLLATSIINMISREIIAVCEKGNIEYDADIVTNGTLLNELVLQQLVRCKIKRIQVTVDGPKDIHDARRIFKNKYKKSSFNTIIKGIKQAKGKIPITIRINIDKQNKKFIYNFINYLKLESILGNDNSVTISLGYVYPWSRKASGIKDECISLGEFSELEQNLKNYINYENEFENSLISSQGLCKAICIDSYLIDPKGRLFKCWAEFGQDNAEVISIGNIISGINKYNDNEHKWVDYNPIKIKKECGNCVFFPLCLGGCPFIRIYQNRLACINYSYWNRKILKSMKREISKLNFVGQAKTNNTG